MAFKKVLWLAVFLCAFVPLAQAEGLGSIVTSSLQIPIQQRSILKQNYDWRHTLLPESLSSMNGKGVKIAKYGFSLYKTGDAAHGTLVTFRAGVSKVKVHPQAGVEMQLRW